MIGLITQEGELTLAEVSFMGKEINMSSGVNSTGQTYALDMQKVSKRFPGTLAVDKVDFRVKKGEVHALMGENGAGKSTLMKMLNGLFNDYTGDIYINGEKKLLHSPTMAKEAGIGMVYQELSLARRISIYENLLVGRLPKKGIFVDKKKAIEESKKLLARVGLDYIDPTMDVSEISQCEAQLVEIAKTLGFNPSIIVMDEPTSALSSDEVERLYKIIRQLKAEGLAVVYISHHLAEIFEIADNVTVMRDGKLVGSCAVADTNPDKLVEMMVGTPVKNFYENHKSMVQDEVVLKVEDYTHWGFFHHVNFELHKGEVLAICGLAGAGRTEIARALIGVDKADGKETHFRNFGEAIAGGLGYLTEDRKVVGLALNQTVGDNVTSCIIDRNSNGIFYNQKKLNGLIDEKINEMSVYPADRDRLVNSFSGGNQQKVLMAKLMAAGVDIMILDEPTRGIDVGAKYDIYCLINKMVEDGKSVIMISSEMPELLGMCDRIYVMSEGRLAGEFTAEEATQERIMASIMQEQNKK